MENFPSVGLAGQTRRLPGSLASLAAALGLGAVTAAAACCVLPLALASVGVGASLMAGFVVLAGIRTPLLMVSAAVLIAAWAFWWHKRKAVCGPDKACAVPGRKPRSLALLIAATVLVVLASIWSTLEPTLLKWVS